ncbi:MAG: HNH endonuclease [Phycisphaerae bacterium]
MARRGSAEWRAEISATLKGRRCSPRTEFKKGHVPWIEGKKGIHMSPATEFKKGNMRGQAARNWKAVGMVTVRKHRGVKRRYSKVQDRGCCVQNYIPLAQWTWRRNFGPIPRGCFVVHRNGNSLDDHPDNLMLMDRKHLFAWQRSIRPSI